MFCLNPSSAIPQKCTPSGFNFLTIVRGPYWIISCYLVNVFVGIVFSNFALAANTQASIIHGTYIAMYFGDDYVVIGSDSRGTHLEQNSSEDNVCKIIQLSKQVVFFGLGVTVGPGFNARDIARSVERGVGDDTDLEKIGAQWGADMVRALEIISNNHARALIERSKKWGDISAGIFVSMIGRNLFIYRVVIKISDQMAMPIKFQISRAPIARPDKITAYFGNQKASHAFIANNPPHARGAD